MNVYVYMGIVATIMTLTNSIVVFASHEDDVNQSDMPSEDQSRVTV